MNTDKHKSEVKIQKSEIRKRIISVPLCLCGSVLFFALTLVAQTKDITRHVNPFIGTGGHGPGATMPFGMVQLSATPQFAFASG
jgi:hypothetical protein